MNGISALPVYFVGAGPGDPGLLTVRALKLLQSADVVLYDALVSEDILALIRHGAQRFAVGKRAGTPCIAQSEINHMLVRLARPGKVLVRLKGGDPAIFARLDEETGALKKAGIGFEVVPGITTASAAAAASGISLTLRGKARSVEFVTAHLKNGEDLDIDWASLASRETTLVFYMAREAAAAISGKLIAHGLEPATPALIMSDVGRETQQSFPTTLSDMLAAVRQAPSSAPLIVLIGEATRNAASRARDERALDGLHHLAVS